ncbi:hypothetical protein L218DRAFT_946165 [Marasmius fiardii PR-910]|nr:hypothetical protein L218DRAFT_946165 [Marasmius fiardii PR-910]
MTYCIVIGPNCIHTKATPTHWRLWVAYLQAEKPGVTLENPPQVPLFDQANQPQNIDKTDVARLASRRKATSEKAGAEQAGIHVNFDSLTQVFGVILDCNLWPPLAHDGNVMNGVPAKHPGKMSLFEFCDTYELSPEIQGKLEGINVDGPHLLSLISDEELQTEEKLTVGQRVAVRDAEKQYLSADIEFNE